MPEVLFCSASGEEVATDWEHVRADEVVAGLPVRVPPTFRGQRNYPGMFWAATDGRDHVYESLLELEQLWLADFDLGVVALATQPLLIRDAGGDTPRSHVPDLLLVHADRRVTLVDVKPKQLLNNQVVADQFAWTRDLCRRKGWGYRVFCGARPVFVRNVRFLASGRRPSSLPPGVLDEARQALVGGEGVSTLGEAMSSPAGRGWASQEWMAAITALVWAGELWADLSRSLGPLTRLSRPQERGRR